MECEPAWLRLISGNGSEDKQLRQQPKSVAGLANGVTGGVHVFKRLQLRGNILIFLVFRTYYSGYRIAVREGNLWLGTG